MLFYFRAKNTPHKIFDLKNHNLETFKKKLCLREILWVTGNVVYLKHNHNFQQNVMTCCDRVFTVWYPILWPNFIKVTTCIIQTDGFKVMKEKESCYITAWSVIIQINVLHVSNAGSGVPGSDVPSILKKMILEC